MPSELAAKRGEPSYVWRAGQERRLKMFEAHTHLNDASRVLVDGAGNGLYATQIRQRYTPHVEAMDIEFERVVEAQHGVPHALVSTAENLPYPANAFDALLSHEVLEHVADDREAAREIVRVLKPGGRAVIFAPNRWYPFETHGHYWNGTYHFGNTPLINYLPNALRDALAPHVRAYTARGIRGLFDDLLVRVVHHSRVYGGYDNIIVRVGEPGRIIRDTLYRFEGTPLDVLGLSHLLVLEKA